MIRTDGIRSALAVACVALMAAACGGGGGGYGGGGGGGGGGGPPADPTYTAGMYPAASTLAAYCASPRTGTDPYTHNAYPDRPGSAVWEKFWLRSWIHAYYLWFDQAPDLNPTSTLYPTATAFFAADKAPDTVDHFHFTYPTASWEALSQGGASIGYGATWSLIKATAPNRQVLLAYTEPAGSGYPATSASAHLARGASIIAVDGVDLINSTDTASINALNAGLFPAAAGETHSFTVIDAPGAASRVVTMQATSVTEMPVQNFKAPTILPGNVGYLLFNDHIATAEGELMTAVSALAAANVGDLVLDIRYNGGGYLDIASELAFMIAGPAPTAGKTFDLVTFSSQYPITDPITNQPIAPTPFWSITQGIQPGLAAGQALPHLNLPRVFVLTGSDTCSASEAIINSLRGVNVQVILIGSQTCGKPYGFYPQDNCGTTYFSIEFKGVNQAGFGDYTDGFVALNTSSTTGVKIDGCSVADDYAHALGDPAEGRLAAALSYRAANGVAGCPTPATGVAPPQSPLSVDGHIVKPEWLKNRILRPQ